MTTPLTLTTFFVAGLDCPAEEQLIRRQLQTIPEIEKMDFNFIAEEVTIHHRLNTIEPLQRQIEALGMSVRTKSSTKSDSPKEANDFSWWWLAVAGLLALFSEVLSYLFGTEKSVWVAALALVAMAISGPPTFKRVGLLCARKP